MTKKNLTGVLVAIAIAGLAAWGRPLAAAEGETVGLETYTVACAAGDPMSIEVAPSTGRVELKFDTGACLCFRDAEAATAWLQGEAQKAMSGGDDWGFLFTGFVETMVAEPPLGGEVEVVSYCFTREAVESYLQQLTPAETAPASP